MLALPSIRINIFIASRVYGYSQGGMGGGWEGRRRKIQIKEATAGIIISKLPQCILCLRERNSSGIFSQCSGHMDFIPQTLST